MQPPITSISFRFKLVCLAAAVLVFANFATPLFAGSGDKVQSGRKTIKFFVQQEPLHRSPPYYRVYVMAGTAKLTFLMPDGFAAGQGADPDELALTRRQGGVIALSILDSIALTGDGPSAEVCRNKILERFPNAKFTLEFSRGSGPTAGRGFDFTWKTSNGITQVSRFVYVPSTAGTLEFRASTSPDKFQSIQSSLNSVIGTLSVGTEDNLKVPQLSDAI